MIKYSYIMWKMADIVPISEQLLLSTILIITLFNL